MRKRTGFVLAAFLIVFVSCKDTGPANYKTLVGSWHCNENSIYSSRNYLIDIYRLKTDTTQYLLSNFQNISLDDIGDVRAKLSGLTLTIEPMQNISNGGSTNVTVKSGSGVVSADLKRIDLNYVVYDGKADNNVHAIYSRP